MTFESDLEEIGLTVQRKTVNKHKLRGYVFARPHVKEGLCLFYKISPEAFRLTWAFEDDYEFAEFKNNTWRFRAYRSGFC